MGCRPVGDPQHISEMKLIHNNVSFRKIKRDKFGGLHRRLPCCPHTYDSNGMKGVLPRFSSRSEMGSLFDRGIQRSNQFHFHFSI